MKMFFLLTVMIIMQGKAAFCQAEKTDKQFAAAAAAVNEKIKCCRKLKRKISFTRGGEFILAYNERWNFFSLVPFTGKEEILKSSKRCLITAEV